MTTNYFKLEKTSDFFDVQGTAFFCKELKDTGLPEEFIGLLVMAVKDGNSWAIDNPYVFDEIMTKRDCVTAVKTVPKVIDELYKYKVEEHSLKKHYAKGDYAKLVKVINEYIAENFTPNQWENHGLLGKNVDFSNLIPYGQVSTLRDRSVPFFWCRHCKTVHLAENLPDKVEHIVCKECLPNLRVCAQCEMLHLKRINSNYKFISLCSERCDGRYRPKMPRSDYDYSKNNDIKADETTFDYISNRSFGLELETVHLQHIKPYNHLLQHWKIVGDGSLRSGGDNNNGEWVSSILRGDNGLKAINRLADYFDTTGITHNESCGFHVHIGCEDYDAQDLFNMATFIKLNEPAFRNLERKDRRQNDYCPPVTYSLPTSIDGFDADEMFLYLMDGCRPDSSRDKMDKVERFKRNKKAGTRYRWVNFCPWLNQKTVEIRSHRGTVDRKEMVNWTKLWVGVFDSIKSGKLKARKYRTLNSIIDNCEFVDNCGNTLKEFYTNYARNENGSS